MISFKNIELRLGTKVLLQRASLSLNPGEKASLVGSNGVGKSTLFALLSGQVHEDAGDVEMPTYWQISQVEQHMPESTDSATKFVLQGDARLMAARASLERVLAQEDGMAIAQAYSDLADAGDHDSASRAQSLILGLGFSPSDLENPVNSFSGGWRMRLQLARALMCPCDLLLLDEPTNHLDLDALVWLEAWLQKFEGTLLIISHDREFLDAVTAVTVHLEHQCLNRYNGNYSAFERLRADKMAQQQTLFSKQQERTAHLKNYIDRFRYKATKARQAQSRIKALERMEKVTAAIAEAEFTFTFKEPLSLPSPMLAIDNADFGYPSCKGGDGNLILRSVHKSVLAGQRIGILGANGQGKSTFIKTIARNLVSMGGSIVEGKGLAIGYFAQQELDVLKVDETPLEHMLELTKNMAGHSGQPAREQELRNFLGTFNISSDMVTQSVGTLSGGEKARLVLCMIVWQRPNLLLLDEPTNHLDLTTREALALALNQFDGTVMLVSHDRALLRTVCDEFWLVENGAVTSFDGDLEDYRQHLLDRAKRAQAPARTTATRPLGNVDERTKVHPTSQPTKRLKLIKQALILNDKQTTQAKMLKVFYEEQLAANPDYPTTLELARQLDHLNEEIENLENTWLELEDETETLRAEGVS